MVEQLRIEAARKQIAVEEENLEKIIDKMEKIKRSALALNDGKVDPMSHEDAIHSGWYDMFDDEKTKSERTTPNVQQKLVRSRVKHDDESPDGSKTLATAPTRRTLEVVREFFSKLMRQAIVNMHKVSRNYGSIIKIMAREKKTLRDSMADEFINSHHKM